MGISRPATSVSFSEVQRSEACPSDLSKGKYQLLHLSPSPKKRSTEAESPHLGRLLLSMYPLGDMEVCQPSGSLKQKRAFQQVQNVVPSSLPLELFDPTAQWCSRSQWWQKMQSGSMENPNGRTTKLAPKLVEKAENYISFENQFLANYRGQVTLLDYGTSNDVPELPITNLCSVNSTK